VRDSIDHEAARSADSFTAIMVKSNGFLTLFDQVFVEHIKHLKEGHVFISFNGVRDHLSGFTGAFLTPDVQSEFHRYL
jgi:hypothetical protein